MSHYQSVAINKMMARALHLNAAALTVEGQGRQVNEDALFHYSDQMDTGESLGLYVVCDGIGESQVEDTVSQLVVQTVIAELGKVFAACDISASPDSSQSWLALHQWTREVIANANRSIWEYAQTAGISSRQSQLGAALTLTLIHGDLAAVANVGNCRAYIWRAGELMQITRDHSLATAGTETVVCPSGNPFCRKLGASEQVEVDLFEWKVWPGDKLLLCSDGLWRVFPDRSELGRWLGSVADPDMVCEQLVDEANRRDGADDMSALVIYVEGGGGHVDKGHVDKGHVNNGHVNNGSNINNGNVNNIGNSVNSDRLGPAHGLNVRSV
jgi:PPM family protein phosphatase